MARVEEGRPRSEADISGRRTRRLKKEEGDLRRMETRMIVSRGFTHPGAGCFWRDSQVFYLSSVGGMLSVATPSRGEREGCSPSLSPRTPFTHLAALPFARERALRARCERARSARGSRAAGGTFPLGASGELRVAHLRGPAPIAIFPDWS